MAARKPEGQDLRRAVGTAATSWAVGGAVLVMLLNDHLLKHLGVLPGVVTGKLSDLAFLFFAPVLLALVTRACAWRAVLACTAAPTALFVAINVSPAVSVAFTDAMSQLFPMVLWPDPTDLVAVPMALLALAHVRAQTACPAPRRSPVWQVAVASVGALACVATSPVPMPPTHRPVYMSWEELRGAAVQVTEPRAIENPGKIVVQGSTLLVSERGLGLHVIDNGDPTRPRPLFFIVVPGNVDIALNGRFLYADSFVDLLVFELDLEQGDATLVERLEDHFAYNPVQALPEGDYYFGGVDESQGVVVGAEEIVPGSEVRR